MLYLYNPWKRQKAFGLLTFSGGIEMENWAKMVESFSDIYIQSSIYILNYASWYLFPFKKNHFGCT